MNELVQMIVEKTGLSQDKAQLAVDTVVNYLKGKFPAFGSQLDAFVSKGEEAGGIAEKAKSMVAGLGGLIGKKGD